MVANQTDIDGTMVASCVERFRKQRPHIHCITNSVAQHFTANVVLAAGGTPSMTIASREIGDFVAMSDALLINLGTMDDERSRSIDIAIKAATEGGKPWALDPVFAQGSPIRAGLARTCLSKKPQLLRCNRAEAAVLLGDDLNNDGLRLCTQKFETTIALTGPVDLVADVGRTVSVTNGSALMDRVTTMGCALTALMVGFLAVENDDVVAATSALALFGLAGERAEAGASGPGTFVPHFLDALANLTTGEIRQGAQLS